MSLSTPILTVLSWANAGPARPRPASAISAAEYRASLLAMFLPPMVVFERRRSKRGRVHYTIVFGLCRSRNAPNVAHPGRGDLRRQSKTHQRAGLVIIELAGLVPFGRTHRHDELCRLVRCVQGVGILAGKHGGAHAGADRARAEQVDAKRRRCRLMGPYPHQGFQRSFGSRIRAEI